MRTQQAHIEWRGRGARLAAGLLPGLLALSASCLDQSSSDGARSEQRALDSAMPAYDPSTVIVKFRDVATATAVGDAVAMVGGAFADKDHDGRDDRFRHVAGGRLALLELTGKTSVEQAVAVLSAHPAIEYAEPNWLVRATAIPNDPSFGEQWGLRNTGQAGGVVGADIAATAAWDVTVGSRDVVVAVIDSGVDYTHPDLVANMWVNPGEIPGNGIDDDGNTYIDDVHGINALFSDGDPVDGNEHGTHVAGIIGAAGNDGRGVVGVNWNVSIMALRFLGDIGWGTTANAIECIDYAVMMRNRGVNIRALNNSWGGGDFSLALRDAISAANDADILFVAAAGNSEDDTDIAPHYPSNYDLPNVLSVAATDRNDGLAWFSNYGANTVDLGAPGVQILSTILDHGYAAYSGTSMATPHVVGAAALVWARNGDLTATEVKQILMDTGDPTPALAGRTVSGKRLDVASAVAAATPAPSFKLEPASVFMKANRDETATLPIEVTSLLGFTDPVTLSVSASPALNAAMTFTPNPAPAGTTAHLNVHATAATATGDYVLTITGTSGAITRSRHVNLSVRPAGTIEVSYAHESDIDIPDDDTLVLVQPVPEALNLYEVLLKLEVDHFFTDELEIDLTSPAGTNVVVVEEGNDYDNRIFVTFRLSQFRNQSSAGTWSLRLEDVSEDFVGVLYRWELVLVGTPIGDVPPPISLDITSARRVGERGVDVTLGFSGANTSSVEVYRNGTLLGLKPNTGVYRDRFVSTATSFTYAVCEPGGARCSNQVIADL